MRARLDAGVIFAACIVLAAAVLVPAAHAQSELILDNGTAAFSVTGTWPVSTSVAGYYGANYQTHEANGVPPGAVMVDNTGTGFSASGIWPISTSVPGYLGSDYRHHAANGEPPAAIVADNPSGSATGTWAASTSVGGYYAGNYQHHPAGSGANMFTWTLAVPAAGSYAVYARWTAHANRASDAKYTVTHGAGSDVVSVNQKANGGAWQLLGTYGFAAGNATVSLSDAANGYVIADAVMLVPPGAAPNTATWTFAVSSAGSYNVYARWTAHANRASDAKYTVHHGAGSSVVSVNQQTNGGAWNLLGTYGFAAGNATVTLSDQANGYVIADAMMLLPQGAGPNSAAWTPNVPQAGQYEVYARWSAHPNRATNATYTVTHAGGASAVAVNQRQNGGQWNSLGTFGFAPGTVHKVVLTDAADSYVIADAIRLVYVPPQKKLYYIHVDHLNTPRLVADQNQSTVWRWDQHEPFGDNPPNEDPDGNGQAFEFNLRFAGQYFDKETNLHYNYFRDYDSSIGRYVESDPIGLKGGTNTYTYVGGNPISFTDPTGLETYQCRRPLGGLPGDNQRTGPDIWGNPVYHQYSCTRDTNGKLVCGGQGFSGSSWWNSPGKPTTPETDYYTANACRQTQGDNKCFERCLIDEWKKPRPRYGVPFGTDCQEYDDDVNSRCRKTCGLK